MPWRRIFPLRTPPWWQGQILAILLVAAAADLHWLVQPLLNRNFPFITFYPVALVATIWGGSRAGLTTIVLSAAVALELFTPPRFHPAIGLDSIFSATLYLALGVAVVLLVNHLRVISRKEAEVREQLEVVSDELRHRIKNILTIVDALSRQTARNSTSVEAYEAAFRPRLMALVAAQNLLIQTSNGVRIRRLLDETLKPFGLGPRLFGRMEGPDVIISPQRTVVLALVLNELATNATKYGALSVPRGQVALTWALTPGGDVHMSWRELDGPRVEPPTRSGFGSRLFSKGLSNGGEVHVDYRPDGVDCQIVFRP